MTKALPPNPSLERLKKEAKARLKAYKDGDPAACRMLTVLPRFRDSSVEDIRTSSVSLQEIQHILAREYGFHSWRVLKDYLRLPPQNKSLDEPTDWLSLFDGLDVSAWAIPDSESDAFTIEHGAVVLRDRFFKAELGGMSWDNYILSADLRIEREGPKETYHIQFTGDGTCIYCELLPGTARLSYISHMPGEGRKTAQERSVMVPERKWFQFQMQAQHDFVTALLDGEGILSSDCPRGTSGMPGFMIEPPKDPGAIRLKNIRIKFLSPTAEQLQEYNRDAWANWKNYERTHGLGENKE